MRDFSDAPGYQEAACDDAAIINDPSPTVSVSASPDDGSARIAQQEQQKRLQQQRRTMIHLTTHPAVAEGDLEPALWTIVSAAAGAIQVSWVNIWRLSSDGELCRCVATIEPGGAPRKGEQVIEVFRYPEYFTAMRGGLVLDVANVGADPRTKSLSALYWEQLGITSVLTAPIRLHGQMVGAVSFDHVGGPRAWYPDEVTFASQIAALVAQVFLNADLRRRAEELALLTRISRQIAALHNLPEVLDAITHYVAEVSQADVSGVFALIPDGSIVAALQGLAPAWLDIFQMHSPALLRKGVFAEAIHTRHPRQVTDLSVYNDKLTQRLCAEEGLQTVLVVPMYSGEEVVGGIGLAQRQPRYFSVEETAFLQALAQQSVNAVESARLFQAEHRQREIAERLQETALLVNSSLELKEVLALILNQLGHVFPYESGSIQILEDDAMRVVAVRNLASDVIGRRYLLNEYPYHRRLAAGESVLLTDIHDKADGVVAYNEVTSTRSNIGVPLWVRERVIGALTIDCGAAKSYTPEEIRIVQAFAQQAAIAIQNARLFEKQRAERALAEALATAAAVVGNTLDLEQVLDRILEQTARVVNGDIFNIMLIKGDKSRMVRWRGYENYAISGSEIAAFDVPVSEYPKLVEMIESGQPVLVGDIFQSTDWVLTNPYRRYLRSYVAAPIRIAEKTVGFLNVNGTRPNQFTFQDALRLKVFADHAAIAIQNANLYQQQRHYADQLEQEVRKRTAELEAKNAWLEAILRSTTDGIIVTDSAGEIVQQNTVVDTWLKRTLSSESAKRLCDTVRRVARRAEERAEQLLELPGLDLQLNAAPIADSDAGGPAVVVAVHDISYLKALDRMKSRFVSDVSHELRTPLASIRLYTSLVRTAPEEKLDQYLLALDREADRLARLVADILQLSRIESGRLDINLQPTDINVLAETTIASHMVLAESKGLNLTYHANAHTSQVEVDLDKFSQVLNNLIENAINYTPAGGHIQVSTQQQSRDGRKWVTVTVADTGMGISEDEVQYIFDRFFRGEGPRQQQIQGTGLGLAIVKEILDMHGGTVTVKSEVGVGSIFTVWLPLKNSD
ncbi:MAG TPA: GAF domain-containing protein [Anaerolineae bacterium]|nr:GAF domain-containing protein [Anaerolineae bacterium]